MTNARLEAFKRWNEEYETKYAFIKERDSKTIENLLDGYEIRFMKEGIEYSDENDEITGIRYSDFIVDFMVSGEKLANPNDIVLASSVARLRYSSPGEGTEFNIRADNEMIGFSRLELATKALKYFHLLYYLYSNFDIDKGQIVESGTEIKSKIFSPVFEYEYRDNGLSSLKYDKNKNVWNCIYMDYI